MLILHDGKASSLPLAANGPRIRFECFSGSKADAGLASRHVRSVPLADMRLLSVSNIYLGTDLNNTISRQLEVAARIVSVASQQDEQAVLPRWHPGARV
jgi:hypothetical protein